MEAARIHVLLEDIKTVEIAGKMLHFFALSDFDGLNNDSTLLDNLCIPLSEVIEAIDRCSNFAIQRFLVQLKALQENEVAIPEYVLLDRSRWEHQAITPVPLPVALRFWSQQSQAGDHWAKLVTKGALQVEEAVFGAFGWGEQSVAVPSLAWGADRDGGLRVPTTQGFTPPVYRYGPVEQTCADKEVCSTGIQTRVGLP